MSSNSVDPSRRAARERLVAVLLSLTALTALGFAAAFAAGAQTQLCAALLAAAFATLAAAMVVFEHEVMPRREAVEERGSLPSGDAQNVAAAEAFLAGARDIGVSRVWLVRVFGASVATLGVALLFPLRALAPRAARPSDVGRTNWRKGSRLVREDGTPVKAADLDVNSIVTVFPQGFTGDAHTDAMANDATVVVRVPPNEIEPAPARAGWAPDGLLAFSKVCTHAGCPVALYRAAARQLFCPCHQSTFDVLRGGRRVFGPAARGLPQLPLTIADDGTLTAADAYPEPIGPGYWERA